MSIKNPSVGLFTLGCKVNQYESEAIAEAFEKKGFHICSPNDTCDVYVINTCTVTAESDRKARQFIRRAIHKNPKANILVTGCYAQTQPNKIAEIEGVDFICGNADKLQVVAAAEELLKAEKKNLSATINNTPPDAYGFEHMKIKHFDRTRAYVKIEDGCESRCTYCIIPNARGQIRSKAPSDVLDEVRGLTDGGCREIVLTGIETASYGKDLDGYTLADLLCEIDQIPNIGRIRLGSLDPSLMKPAFVERISKLSSLAPHFHLSMQSGSDKILALMKRKYNARIALDAIQRVRDAIPHAQFTTDMIVGFPQESEEDFLQSEEFIKKAEFLMVHVFPYSKRAGTPAATMSGQIPEQIKHARVAKLSKIAEEVRGEILKSCVGQTYSVLFETYENGMMYGHTPSFIEVACPSVIPLHSQEHTVLITSADHTRCNGKLQK